MILAELSHHTKHIFLGAALAAIALSVFLLILLVWAAWTGMGERRDHLNERQLRAVVRKEAKERKRGRS